MYEMMYEHRNEGTTQPLVLSLNIECNTDEKTILANVLVNSKRPLRWIKREEPHEGVALICGSGPSVDDELETIKAFQEKGATIFALNNCAKFLYDNGVMPDYQVIMDAQPKTISLIGPAKSHLFASQCDPALFDKVEAILWHSTHGDVLVDEQEGFDSGGRGYCLIGSSATVGNTTLTLAHAMGYRRLEVFGMDSSHRDGKGHVLHQSINDGDPCMVVNFRGREFVCSLTMKMQAECFVERAIALIEDGSQINVYGDGYLPTLWRNPLSEQEKYDAMWRHPIYAVTSPGEQIAQKFVDVCKPKGRIADFGCGSGKGSLEIARLTGIRPILVDFVEHSRVEAAREFEFVKADLAGDGLPLDAHFGFCTDVMEHIPPESVDRVIQNLMSACDSCFFQISTVHDNMGGLIGHPLHLTVKPHSWWRDKFTSHGYAVAWEEEQELAALFWIT